jgi:predicted AAA+ superfamily ATPase
VDERPEPGRFVLTGSQNFAISQAVSQSLAGRVALTELLPLSAVELTLAGHLGDVWTTIFRGGYPALYDRQIEPSDWFAGYVATYVERDVRQLLNVTDAVAFETFVALTAARTSQLVELSRLGADVGITQPTARKWLTVLEASYLAFRLPPFSRNLGKRLVKTPKLHFFDTGLLCYLLRIRSAEQLRLHPLRGAIFETWVLSELVKAYRNAGERPGLTFFRDRHGLEADGVVELGLSTCVIEAKSGETVAADAFTSVDKVLALFVPTHADATGALIYAGEERWSRKAVTVLPWRDVGSYPWPGLPERAVT